jgi:hypothetical protein
VGEIDGSADGSIDAFTVGNSDGNSDGVKEGGSDEIIDGVNDGAIDGKTVGRKDGLLVVVGDTVVDGSTVVDGVFVGITEEATIVGTTEGRGEIDGTGEGISENVITSPHSPHVKSRRTLGYFIHVVLHDSVPAVPLYMNQPWVKSIQPSGVMSHSPAKISGNFRKRLPKPRKRLPKSDPLP